MDKHILLQIYLQSYLYKTNTQTEVFTAWSKHHPHCLIGVTQNMKCYTAGC